MGDVHPDYEAMKQAMASFGKGHGHADCSRLLREVLAAGGSEVTVSTMGPLVLNPYVTEPFRCPHGVTFWVEPTAEQVMRWRRDGVR
jgi:hypothetical protein